MKKALKTTSRNWKYFLIGVGFLVKALAPDLLPTKPTPPSRYHFKGSYHPKEGVKVDVRKR